MELAFNHFTKPVSFMHTNAFITCAGNLSSTGAVSYEIFNFLGKRIYRSGQLNIGTGHTSLRIPLPDFQAVPSGQYILMLKNSCTFVTYPFSVIK